MRKGEGLHLGANWPRERASPFSWPSIFSCKSSIRLSCESFIIISLFTSLFALPLFSLSFSFFPFTPVFASPSRCAGQCGTAPISFLCAFRTRAQAWLCGLSSWDTLRQKIRSLDRASRSSRRGLLPRLYRPSWVRSRHFKSASIQINTRTRSLTQFFFLHPVRFDREFE